MKEKLTFIFIMIVLLTIYVFLLSMNYVTSVSSDLSDSVLRLHIIANSDSQEDQELKLKVRDNIIKYMNNLTKDISNKESVISLVNSNINNFKKVALDTIHDNGYNYDVNIELGNFYFPTKDYDNVSFPSGNYDALKIEIGNAIGQNWWCVLFPPLCLVGSSSGTLPDDSQEILENTLNSEEYELISEGRSNNSDNSNIQIKFKLIEWFNQFNKD